MRTRHMRQIGLALAMALGLAATGAAGTLAQENLGAVVTVGGGAGGGVGSDIVVMAPGVTISGGEVTNATGIGIDSGGGSSIGTTTGGSDSAAIVE